MLGKNKHSPVSVNVTQTIHVIQHLNLTYLSRLNTIKLSLDKMFSNCVA